MNSSNCLLKNSCLLLTANGSNGYFLSFFFLLPLQKNQSWLLIGNCHGHVAIGNFHFWMGKLKHVDDFIRTSFSNRNLGQLCSCNCRLHWIKRWPAGVESFVPILVLSYLSSWGWRGVFVSRQQNLSTYSVSWWKSQIFLLR